MEESPYQPPSSPVPPPLPPSTTDRTAWNGWWTLLWFVVLFFVWQIFLSAGLFVALISTQTLSPSTVEKDLLELATDGDVSGLIGFSSIFIVCPLCWLIGKTRKGWNGWEYLGHGIPHWWHWPVWGVATIACSAAFGLLTPYLGLPEKDASMVAMANSTQIPFLLYLGVGIGAPLVEEFIFRGTLWRGWRESKVRLPGALVITSFLWAILHVQYPIAIICYIFVLGLLLGLAREKTGSIWIPIWMHALNNGLAFLGMMALGSAS